MSNHYPPQARRSATTRSLWLVIIGSVAIGLIACSSESLWIDEAWMALLSAEPNLAGWYRRMWEISGSTLQMPLYAFYIWLWEKLAGHSEWALRAANIPFFVLGQWAFLRSFRRKKHLALVVCLIAAVSPFLWAYLNEARSYMMEYCGACLIVAGLFQLTEHHHFSDWDLTFFCFGFILLCGSTTLAFPWAGMAIVAASLLYAKDRTLVTLKPHNLLVLSLTGLALVLILLWDSWTALKGAKASSVGRTGYENIFFAGYELLGFTGLGPSRLAVRAIPSLATFQPFLLPLAALACALVAAIIQLRQAPTATWRTILIYSVLPIASISLLGVLAPFRLLARHIAPVAPVIFVSLGYAALAPAKWWLNRLFILFWFVSAVTLRINSRYHRDDYRNAAGEAREALAQSKRVWWAADKAGAEYYQLKLMDEARAETPSALVTINRNDFQGLPKADTVILSKPDLYDSSGALQRFLKTNEYQLAQTLPAFTIWRAAPVSSNQ